MTADAETARPTMQSRVDACSAALVAAGLPPEEAAGFAWLPVEAWGSDWRMGPDAMWHAMTLARPYTARCCRPCYVARVTAENWADVMAWTPCAHGGEA